MARRVRVTDEAFSQMEAIRDFIAKDSPLNAARWLDKLHRRIQLVAHSAESHAVLYTPEQAGLEVRQTFYGTYRILYSIDGDVVHVLSVRHGARRPMGPDELREA
jgi:toxin ParE1/3/4